MVVKNSEHTYTVEDDLWILELRKMAYKCYKKSLLKEYPKCYFKTSRKKEETAINKIVNNLKGIF